MNSYPVQKNKGISTVAGILALFFALLSVINLIFVTQWLSYLTFVLFIIDLIFAIYWISKRDAVMIIPIIAALTQLFPINSIIGFGADNDVSKSNPSVNIASYNVGTFKYKSLGTASDIIAIMQKENVDVICFQEFAEHGDPALFCQKFSCYPYCCIQDSEAPGSTRLAIFSRYPIISSNKLIFKNNINSAMSADLQIKGKVVRVINCHFQTTGINQNRSKGGSAALEGASDNSLIRNQQVDAVASIIDMTTVPVILCGDFNDPPTSYSYRIIRRRLRDGFSQSGEGLASTFIGGFKSILRIDYIFNSDELECTRYIHPDYVFSDHKPVISTLEYKMRK